jgi:hypothetical protein
MTGAGWNTVAKKGKMQAAITGEIGLTDRILKILKRYPIFWSNGVTP